MKANHILSAALFVIVAGCVPAPRPAPPPRSPAPKPAPAPQPEPVPAPPAPADWRNAPQTAGLWTWAMDQGRSTARYGVAGAAPVAMLTCDPARRATILWRTGPAARPASGQIPLVVTTTGTRMVLSATPDSAGGASVAFTPSDPLLDAMAFSRGRFMLEMPGSSTLYLPSWPEISRVIEDCR